MKITILIFLLVFSLSYNYDADKAVEYANEYCSSTEIDLSSLRGRGRRPILDDGYDGSGSDFVTKCLIAGGFDTNNCVTDDNGSISKFDNLSSCLTQKGWKSSTTMPSQFKAGYPVFVGKLSFIATEVGEGIPKYSSHSYISLCNEYLGSIIGDTPLYFYLE